MIGHKRALELSAASLDFELSPADDAALTTHLESCEPCRLTGEGMRADAVSLVELDRVDAPEDLRERIMDAATQPAALDGVPSAVGSRERRLSILRFPARIPERFRQPAQLVAAAAVIIAVIGGTLAWRTVPGDGGVAIVDPSSRPSGSPDAPGGSADPSDPGGPGPTNPPGTPTDDLVTAWSPVADLSAEGASAGVVGLDSSFLLAGVDGTPARELARRLTVQPPLELTATTEADGRVRLTPAEPLTPGTVYQFTLTGPEGQTLDTWAFQARQPLRVVGTLPQDTETDVRVDTGIEVTFDQDGVVDAESHMTIEPKVAGHFEQHDRVLAFVPDRLAPATIYTITISKGVTVGATGESLEADVRFQFETAKAGDPTPTETTFRFANDLFESAVADRPLISLWAFAPSSDDGSEAPRPDSVRLEVYRLADHNAAVDVFRRLREVPRWSQWNAEDRVPTAGLSRVAGIDAHLEDLSGTLWTRLPEALPAGWYLVEQPSTTRRAQAVLQVTDIAGYLIVSDTQTLVWANDLSSGAPIAAATITAEGNDLGRTGADGTLIVKTPPALLPDLGRECSSGCTPVVTVTSGGQAAFLPATGSSNPDGKEGFGGSSFFDGPSRYWRLFDTDRFQYRQTDTVNVWGVLRDRDTGKVPGSVTLRLKINGDETGDANPPLVALEATPRPTGAFTGSLTLRDVPDGSYHVELWVGDELITARGLEVGRILKPAYRLEVVTGRRVYIVGDRIRVTATASFYEGTPVPGVPLQLSGDFDSTPTTDATGTAIVRGIATLSEDDESEGPRYQSVGVRPARAEEGEIEGASREFIVFPSSWTIGVTSRISGGRVRVSGDVHVVDVDRLEAEVADGTPVWDLDPRGAPVKGRTLRAIFTERIPVRTQAGTTYDFIEKRVVPVYEYETNEREAATLRITTDERGRFSATIPAANPDHEYSVKFTLTDPDGHVARATTYASPDNRSAEDEGAPILALTTARTDEIAFGVGEEIDLTMREPGVTGTAGDRHLFYLAQRGLREATVQRSSRFVTAFPAWAPPNVEIGVVRFTGSGYVVGGSFTANFRSSDRAITVDLQPDKARYAQGEQVTLGVRTRDAKGAAVPATVVLSAVDEKLFAIGMAAALDPLPDLYTWLGSGIRATYASHRPPRVQSGCCDTGGGGGDGEFKDSVLFTAVDTDSNGRASVTFRLAADLTSWRVNASAIGAGLQAGLGSTVIPVGLPFFVDAAIAPEYLAADRPKIQLRAFGTSVDAETPVTFSVDSDSLGLHEAGLRGTAFAAVTVALPPLKVGSHTITITARTGSGASARRHRIVRTIEVVASRLTRTRTSYEPLSGSSEVAGGDGLTDIVVSDAGSGQELPLLFDLASLSSARLERALAADLAASLIVERFGDDRVDPGRPTFDGLRYQTEDGGVAILPYASSDLEISALAALVAPDRFDGTRLRTYFRTILRGATETRERRNFALAGLAGLGAPVLPEIAAASADVNLTIRERLMLGLGAAALGDASTARSVAASLAQGYGETVGDQARLRVGDDGADITAGTALMAMLMAAIGDPVAPRYRAYVVANPSLEAPHALHAVGYVKRILDHHAPKPGSFAYVIADTRKVVELGPGESFHLRVTKEQLASLVIEPVSGEIGVTSSWREPVKPSAFEPDLDVAIERIVTPAGDVRARDLVVVDLVVKFGPKAAGGCHRVTELVPSGLTPVGVLRGWVDPESGEVVTDVTYPEEQTAQRVVFCADPASASGRLRYVARVITVGTYVWEPAIVESRTGPDRAAVTPRRELTIR